MEEFNSKLSEEIEGDTSTLSTPESISEPVALALSAALTKIEAYVPTQYVDYTEPDIDAEHLNHAEQAIMRVTGLMNGAVDVINALVAQVNKNESDISSLNSQQLNMNELSVNKSLGSPGWYRFAKRNVPNEVSAKYAGGEVLTIKIVRAFNNAQNEAYDISCTLSFEKYSYKLLNSSVKSGLITKIREVYYPDDGLCYLEIYYNGTSINDVKIFLRATKNHYEAVRLEPSVGTPTEILNFNIESIQTDLKWISKNNSGLLAGLVMPNTIWLIVGVHLKQKEVVAGIAYKPDESTNTVFTTIYSTENMHISTNNQGTVAIQYQNTSTGISSFALQLV